MDLAAKRPSDFRPSGVVEHLPAISVVTLTVMTVVAHLVPCDTSAAQWHNVAPVMLWMLLLVGWALAGVLRGRASLVFDRSTLWVLVLTLLPGVSAAYLCLSGSGNCRLAMNLAWQWASFGIAFFLSRQWLKSAADVRMLAAVMVAVSVGLSTLALVQFAVIMPQTRAEFERNPDQVLRNAGLDPNGSARERKHFKDRLDSTEPTATFALTNSLAGLLTPWLVMLCGVAAVTLRKQPQAIWRFVIPLVIIAATLVLTKSRTATLATAAGVGLVLIYATPLGRRIDWRILIAVAVIAVGAGLGGIVSGALDVEVLSEAPKSVFYRLQYWQATAAMIRHFPLFGAGPGNFQDTYKWYQLPEASENLADPHNFILEIWATAGTLALLALVGLMWVFAAQLRAASRLSKDAATATSGRLTAPIAAHAAGLVVGVLLGFGCGFLGDLMPTPALLYTAVPAAGIVLWLLVPWIKTGELTLPMLIAPLVALLINLLAAGGISFPGVATSVWLLMAMALVIAGQGRERTLSRAGQVGWLVIAAVAGILFHVTVYNPVFRSTGAQSEATLAARSGQINDAIKAATLAAELDPASPQPWMSTDPLFVDLTDLWFTRLASEGDTKALRTELDIASDQAVTLDPRSEGTQSQLAHRYLALYRQYGKQEDLDAARYYYLGAVTRYPNNALVHAQLAWVLHLAGEDEKANWEAQTAYDLDRRHEHIEHKLSALTIYDSPPAPGLKQLPPPSERTAEPIVAKLRKASTP